MLNFPYRYTAVYPGVVGIRIAYLYHHSCTLCLYPKEYRKGTQSNPFEKNEGFSFFVLLEFKQKAKTFARVNHGISCRDGRDGEKILLLYLKNADERTAARRAINF